MHRILLLLLFFYIPSQLLSQVLPKEGSKLNYRLIGFSSPQTHSNGKCTLEIAAGNYNSNDSFNKHIIKSLDCRTGKIIAEVPAFGQDYTWCVAYTGRRSGQTELHHFSTMMSPNVDTTIKRLRIINEAQKYKGAYIFIDGMQALYDMQGNPVWFLPESLAPPDVTARDIKLSPQGTITFVIEGDNVYEINFKGDILWKGPNTGEISRKKTEDYHNEFTRFANDHYMVLGSEYVLWKLPGYKTDSLMADPGITIENTYSQGLPFGTVIEYDEKGKVVWSWRSSDYFKGSDLYNHKTEDGRFDVADVHENSFFFDEKNKCVYVSFRSVSRILKVKYPEGKVIADYGNMYDPDSGETANELFYGQHCVKVSHDGYLYLYNNNALQEGLPSIIMMQEPVGGKGYLKKIWEYVCSLDGVSDDEQKTYNKQMARMRNENKAGPLKTHFTAGGSVTELPDQSILASMNAPCSKVFIVTRDKKILWSALPEIMGSNGIWSSYPTYRVSMITNPEDLEKLIWNAEMKK